MVMESFGRALVLEPFFATVVLGGTLVSQAGTPEQKAAILPKVAAGELLLAFALHRAGDALVADRHRDDRRATRTATGGRSPARRSRCSAPTAPTR